MHSLIFIFKISTIFKSRLKAGFFITMSEAKTHFKPTLGLVDATMIVAGSMIGSGIFIVSADITRNVGSAGWLIVVWLITGFMTITAAVSYGELSSMYPKAGGQYVYLKEAFNPLAGFLYGWSLFAVIQTATIAAVGVAFSKFTAYLIPSVSENHILFTIRIFKNFCCTNCSNCAHYFSYLYKHKRHKRRQDYSNNIYISKTYFIIWFNCVWIFIGEAKLLESELANRLYCCAG